MKKYVYFLSDLHLGAPYIKGSREAELRVVRFLDSIKNNADAIYLLGDILDYWYEYRYVVPRGFVRFFGKLAELSDSGIKIVWFIGNHDIWIFDYLPDELGVEVIDGSEVREIKGKKIFLSHGDGVGTLPTGFRVIRSVFRNRLAQFLFGGIHPRWTVPFAYAWSRKSRMDREGEKESAESLLSGLRNFVRTYHLNHPDVEYYIFGHIHLMAREEIEKGCELVVLGEWLKLFSYARLGDDGLELLQWKG